MRFSDPPYAPECISLIQLKTRSDAPLNAG